MRRDVPGQAEDELVPVTKQLYPIRLHKTKQLYCTKLNS
jgi:hypothetical protein